METVDHSTLAAMEDQGSPYAISSHELDDNPSDLASQEKRHRHNGVGVQHAISNGTGSQHGPAGNNER